MVWFLGKKVASHQGSTWFAELQPWTSLSYVTSDAGAGLKAGIARMQKLRGETNQVPLEKGLDVFHTKREGRRALRMIWMRVERAWERAEAADRALKRARWQGRGERKLTQQVHEAWTKAFAAFKLYEKREAVWKRAETALDVFRPDGQLNDRAWAQEQVAWALSRLPGSEWSKVRGLLQSKESFTFLDRLHDQLGRLSLPETSREPWCGYGGCGGNCRGNRPRRRSGVIAMRLPWCSRFSAKNWTRTGESRIVRSRPC